MLQKVAIISGLIISATCTILHHGLTPNVFAQVPQDRDANYNFAYEVNDYHTGDIKSQNEARRGEIVLGQYTLLQPDGVRRTVDYRADGHSGFRAIVNNSPAPVNNNHAILQPALQGEVNNQQYQQRISSIVQPSLPLTRNVIIQSVSNSNEPRISTFLHK